VVQLTLLLAPHLGAHSSSMSPCAFLATIHPPSSMETTIFIAHCLYTCPLLSWALLRPSELLWSHQSPVFLAWSANAHSNSCREQRAPREYRACKVKRVLKGGLTLLRLPQNCTHDSGASQLRCPVHWSTAVVSPLALRIGSVPARVRPSAVRLVNRHNASQWVVISK
jgi:hypothetical protein